MPALGWPWASRLTLTYRTVPGSHLQGCSGEKYSCTCRLRFLKKKKTAHNKIKMIYKHQVFYQGFPFSLYNDSWQKNMFKNACYVSWINSWQSLCVELFIVKAKGIFEINTIRFLFLFSMNTLAEWKRHLCKVQIHCGTNGRRIIICCVPRIQSY